MTEEVQWYKPMEKWPFVPGEPVAVKMPDMKGGPKLRLGRIECVRLNYCPEKEQDKDPNEDTLWPIYFYGTSKRAWIPVSRLLGPVELEDIRNSLQRFQQGFDIKDYDPSSDVQLKNQIDNFMNNPTHNHQFPFDVNNEDEIRSAQVRFKKWWYDGDDSVKLENDWLDLSPPLAVKRTVLNPLNSAMVYDDMNSDYDPLQVHYQMARIKIEECQVDDIIGCVYDEIVHVALVHRKEPNQILVHFYRPKKASKKATPSSPKADGRNHYIRKQHDSDFINEKRQGYIVYRLSAKSDLAGVDKWDKKRKYITIDLKARTKFADYVEEEKKAWDLHKMKLDIKDEPVDEGYMDTK